MRAVLRLSVFVLTTGLVAAGCDSDGNSDGDDGGDTGVAGGGAGGGAGFGFGGGDGVGGGAAGGETFTLDEMPAKVGEAACGLLERCFGELASLFLGDIDCEGQFSLQFADGELPAIRAAIEAGRVTFHGELGPACLDDFLNADCSATGGGPPGACDDIFEGSVAAGGDCTLDEECVGTSFCAVDDACPGTCTARGAAGAPCEESEHCAAGLSCNEGAGECEPPVAVGQACEGDENGQCQVGLMCLGSDEEAGTPGTCTEPSTIFVGDAGDACDLAANSWCKAGLSCVVETAGPTGATFVCAEAATPGGACSFGVPEQCPSTHFCNFDPNTGSFDGTCVERPGAGADCLEAPTGTICAIDLICVDDKCGPMQRIGGTCTAGDECYSGNCDGSTCLAGDLCAQ